MHLSNVVCKQLRVVFLFSGGQIGGEVVEGHLGFPLGEGEENAGKSSMVLVPGIRMLTKKVKPPGPRSR